MFRDCARFERNVFVTWKEDDVDEQDVDERKECWERKRMLSHIWVKPESNLDQISTRSLTSSNQSWYACNTKQLSYNKKIKSNDTLSSSSRVILQLCKDLLKSYDYVVFMNNFFSSVKLFKALKREEINACDTAKLSSEYSNQLLHLRLIFIKAKNWDLRAHMIVKDEILCLAWQNNNVLQYMIISHDLFDLD